MLILFPLMVWSAISQAILSASLVPLLVTGMSKDWSHDKELEKAKYAMIGLGVGEVIGGLGNGQLQDKFGYKIALKANLIQLVLAFAMVIYYTIQESWSMYIAVALNFCWGL